MCSIEGNLFSNQERIDFMKTLSQSWCVFSLTDESLSYLLLLSQATLKISGFEITAVSFGDLKYIE